MKETLQNGNKYQPLSKNVETRKQNITVEIAYKNIIIKMINPSLKLNTAPFETCVKIIVTAH